MMVTHNEAEKQFEIKLGSSLAVLEYRLSGDTIQFLHTEVPDDMAGKGIGGQLAKAGLEYAREHHLKVAPFCPFVGSYIKRHPEYLPLVPEIYHSRIQ